MFQLFKKKKKATKTWVKGSRNGWLLDRPQAQNQSEKRLKNMTWKKRKTFSDLEKLVYNMEKDNFDDYRL